jgi:hypothetical protein
MVRQRSCDCAGSMPLARRQSKSSAHWSIGIFRATAEAGLEVELVSAIAGMVQGCSREFTRSVEVIAGLANTFTEHEDGFHVHGRNVEPCWGDYRWLPCGKHW